VGQHTIVDGAVPIVAIDRRKERIDWIPGEACLYVLQRDVARSHTVARRAGAPVTPKLAPDKEAPSDINVVGSVLRAHRRGGKKNHAETQ